MQSKNEARKRFALFGFAAVVCWGMGLCSPVILPLDGYSPELVGWMKVAGIVAITVTFLLLHFQLERLRVVFDRPTIMAAVIACVTLATAILALAGPMEIPAVVSFLAFIVAGIAGAIILTRWGAAYARYPCPHDPRWLLEHQSSHPSSRQRDSGKKEEFSLALHLVDQNLFTQLHLDAKESARHSNYSE